MSGARTATSVPPHRLSPSRHCSSVLRRVSSRRCPRCRLGTAHIRSMRGRNRMSHAPLLALVYPPDASHLCLHTGVPALRQCQARGRAPSPRMAPTRP